jgi:hypothetical protein
MARTVALWRCKCGTYVKVVAEAGFSSPARQTASCPTCHEARSLGADKIISVTEGYFRRSSSRRSSLPGKGTAVGCPRQSTAQLFASASELADSVGVLAHADFEFLSNKVKAARQSVLEIRKQLNQHTAQHGW